jgi:2,3-diketo-5-methylthio-1-phosphopentane phosphatase
MSAKKASIHGQRVVFDFDNTITDFDVLDDIIERFSINNNWVKLEKAWLEKKIGSEECLRGQLRGVRISRKDLFRYLDRIKISPYFAKLIKLLYSNGVRVDILSDNFSPLIRRVLCNNGIKGVRLYANNLRFAHNHLIPLFPHKNTACILCAHCKTNNLPSRNSKDKILLYIGDGNSDICPAKEADIVFAKGSLAKHFKEKGLNYRRFSSIKDIYNYFKACHGRKTKNRKS